jgi:phage RecT family recombinase
MSTTDYRPVAQQPEKKTLVQLIEDMKPEIARALPKHLNPDRMARIATTVLRQTPALARCTPESFLGALMTASQLGLEPGPLGEAYLVPYGSVATFIPGYRGLIKLAWQSEQLSDIWAEIVYEKDEFTYDLGLNRDLVHRPARGERGQPIYVYAAARLKSGGTPFVVMSVDDVEAIRARLPRREERPVGQRLGRHGQKDRRQTAVEVATDVHRIQARRRPRRSHTHQRRHPTHGHHTRLHRRRHRARSRQGTRQCLNPP